MIAKTGSSEQIFTSESLVNFSSTGVSVVLTSHYSDTIYPSLFITGEKNIITYMIPNTYSMMSQVIIEQLK